MSLRNLRRLVAAARRHALHLVVIAALVLGVSGVFAETAFAAGALTNVSWSVSNNAAGATPVNYSYSFKTATVGVIGKILFTVSGGTLGGTPTIVVNYGVSAGTVARAANIITYTVTTPVSIAANTPIFVELGANTNMAAGTYTTAVTTETAAAAIIDGPTNSQSVTLAASNTAKTIVVAQSTTFTLDTASFQLVMDPTLAGLALQNNVSVLTVQTNANSGYTMTVADSASGLQCAACSGAPIIPAVATSGTFVSWPGPPAAATGYNVTGTGATIPGGFTGTKYTGYGSTALQIASSPTNTGGTANTITVTDQTAIDFAVSAGTYADTITYTVTPNYS